MLQVARALQGRAGAFSYDAGLSEIHSSLGSGLIFDGSPAGTTTTAQTNVRVDGHRLPYTPQTTVNFGLGYDFALPGDAKLTPRVAYSWVGEQTTDILDPLTTSGFHYQRVRAHDITNLALVYARNGLTVTGYVTNLTNTIYLQAAGGGGDNAYYNSPRQFGVRVNKTF